MQVLPFASDETITRLEANIAGLPAVPDLLAGGVSLEKLTALLLEGLDGADPAGGEAALVASSESMQPRYGPCERAALQVRRLSRSGTTRGAWSRLNRRLECIRSSATMLRCA